MIQIIPAVLAASESFLQKDISKLTIQPFKGGWIHFDFMDNKFVPNISISPSIISKYNMPFEKEAHLMVQDPESCVDELIKAGFKRVFFHLEANNEVGQCINYIKEKGLEAGLVLKHETPIEKLEPFADKIDAVILMSVVPGFQGQPFIEGVYSKIKNLKSKNWPIKVGVDGAVKDTNIKKLVEAGADFVVIGSYLLKGDTEDNIERIWEELSR